jgi:ketosteroid isomerase-like protein
MKEIEKLKGEIIKADKDFSILSQQKGYQSAFVAYAANEVVLLRQNNFPVTGIDNMKKLYAAHPNTSILLTWDPVKADVSPDGMLGYTYGQWELTGKDSAGKAEKNYGVYVTVWKRQTDKTWKFVLDGGNSTPQPKE